MADGSEKGLATTEAVSRKVPHPDAALGSAWLGFGSAAVGCLEVGCSEVGCFEGDGLSPKPKERKNESTSERGKTVEEPSCCMSNALSIVF
ncbi:unnamed protein product [Ixodes pacificus]